ncbi:hypothetical protein [Bacillus paranthracis]
MGNWRISIRWLYVSWRRSGMLGNAQTGWLIGMGVGFLGMAVTRLIRK